MPIFVRRIPGEETMPEKGTRVAAPWGGGGQECQRGAVRSSPAAPRHAILAPWLHGRSFSCFGVFTGASIAFPSASELNYHGLVGVGWKLRLFRCNSPRIWKSKLLAQGTSDYKGNLVMWARLPSSNKARMWVLTSQSSALNPLLGPQRFKSQAYRLRFGIHRYSPVYEQGKTVKKFKNVLLLPGKWITHNEQSRHQF